MNIIISGWPGAGTTTLSLLTCNLLGYKYLYAGGIMKYIAQKEIGAVSGPKFVQFEQSYGPKFDQIWEKYADWKIKNTSGMLLEAKAAGFFIESEDVFEVMVIANQYTRVQRAMADKREDAANTIVNRDIGVRGRWQREYGIDLFDIELIRASYDLVLDNTQMSIQQELQTILSHLEEDYRFPKTDLHEAKEQVEEITSQYWKLGKAHFMRNLETRGLLVTPDVVFKEWKQFQS